MNKTEFIEEVNNSAIKPQNFDAIYEEFCVYQRLTASTLNELHRICKENNIKYQLAFGSLLGAIRDKSALPWDYDVDVFVPYEYRNKLIIFLENCLSDDYYFYCPELDNKCRHEILRITPKGYRSEKLHVDVFFVIGVPGNSLKRNPLIDRIVYLSNVRYYKLVNAKDDSYGKLHIYIKLLLYKIRYCFVSLDKIHEEYVRICNNNPALSSVYCTTADKFGKKYIYPSREMWELESIVIDGNEYYIPSNAEDILTIIYGDYMKIPSLEARLHEMMMFYKELKHARIED